MKIKFYHKLPALHFKPSYLISNLYTTSLNYQNVKNKIPKLTDFERGTGGRSSFNGVVCTVFGATGFLGRILVNALEKIGTQVIVPYRDDPYFVKDLKLMGDLGQIIVSPYELVDDDSIRKVMKYSNVVVNLIGRDWETKYYKFDYLHNIAAGKIAKFAFDMGIQKFIHVSSLNVTEKPVPCLLPRGSQFLASKWHGENSVRSNFPGAIIFRPADMYGEGDRFSEYWSSLFRRSGLGLPPARLPIWKKGKATSKMPVYVGDVAKGIVKSIFDTNAEGKTYEAVGPTRYQLYDLLYWMYETLRWDDIRIRDIRFDFFFKFKTTVLENICYYSPFNNSCWERLERDCLTDTLTGCPTLEDLGINLLAVEDRLPFFLRNFARMNYYNFDLGEWPTPNPPRVLNN